ncbi:phage repressor protein CI [Glaesserella parasuis]|uniref:phage repressor protein CI n=3 Tax=Glaesserella parasuis TaxID=738 RepID=UPI0021BD5404|nr:phage repressor protein CI [Glaesserella parasuis]MCT8830303.1 helix-turn-helix domain-containing protein [Glaesserella parasuis]MCT8834578.1 helix-turn-helix domain-containing protein [Glaesserella parasuis]MDG6450337.1 phage repressor protein CI [Glaesserella parasuis]MDO9656563.1 phage repressor protein CI [Glaesserella parasuis]MDO9716229.1 phage repressor protein CI [Glaesserella parasuis]
MSNDFLGSNDQFNGFIGGKGVISRIMMAYGFSNRKLLAEYLGMPHSTFGTWAKRGFFPAELVARCAIETGARLRFLAYGEEPIFDKSSDMKYFQGFKVENGKKFILQNIAMPSSLLPQGIDEQNGVVVQEGNVTYIVTVNVGEAVDGSYFIVVENSSSIRYLTRLPNNRVRVDGGKFSFETDLNDITVVGKVVLKIEKV